MASGGGRQKIRPSLAELKDLPPEYDLLDSANEGEDEDELMYAPAAKLHSGPPPRIGAAPFKSSLSHSTASSSSKARSVAVPETHTKKSVRIAEDIEDEAEEASVPTSSDRLAGGIRGQRFDISFENSAEDVASHNAGSQFPSTSALVGTVQERRPMKDAHATLASSASLGQSRFAARRQLDRDAGTVASLDERSGSMRSKSTKVQTSSLDADEEVWMDEDGLTMSAFRKNRMLKHGLRPPSVCPAATKESFPCSNPIRPAMKGDRPDTSMAALMRSISAENEAKVAVMTADELEDDIRDLQDVFGETLLEKLRNRKNIAASQHEQQSMSKPTTDVDGMVRSIFSDTGKATTSSSQEEDTPALIRSKYFPNEPDVLPSRMKWMQDIAVASKEGSDTLRYDFDGRLLLPSPTDNDDVTRLAGLHHHGDEQDKPGYTTAELLHLARSTNPSQRAMALQTIGRIVLLYPETAYIHASTTDASHDLMRKGVRGQACLVASWYVDERQSSVRSAALACIKACLSSTLAGPNPVMFVEPPEQKLSSADLSSSSDEGVKHASVPSIHEFSLLWGLLGPILRSLQLPGLIKFESSTGLDILVRLARQSRHVCRFMTEQHGALAAIIRIHMLKSVWPVQPDNAQASVSVLQLLNCVVGSSREAAITLTANGMLEPVLRFVAMTPWTLPSDAHPIAWAHFDGALRIYISLARYGIAADAYGRNHTLFVRVEQWIRHAWTGKGENAIGQDMTNAMQSTLRLMTAWTVCASDPHKTYAHHDITWSQVSEWCDLALAVLANVEASAVRCSDGVLTRGEAVGLLHAWLVGAAMNGANAKDVIRRLVPTIDGHLVGILGDAEGELGRLLNDCRSNTDPSPFWSAVLPTLMHISEMCRTVRDVIRLTVEASHLPSVNVIRTSVVRIADTVLQRLPWSVLRTDEAVQAGVSSPMRTIVDMLYLAFLSHNSEGIVQARRWIQLAAILPRGQEAMANDVLLERLPASLNSVSPQLAVLRPFITELLRPMVKEAQDAPLAPSSASLPITETLFLVAPSSPSSEPDLDPLSGAPLWKGANAGLPLRADWPFAALDDLLHSGRCAALNRPDALSRDWDANERQIVQASLLLGRKVWSGGIPTSDGSSTVMPTQGEVWMGMIKVFMLEEEQAGNGRATGNITGCDIFRDEQVAQTMVDLFVMANEAGDDVDDLERVAERQFGVSLPFFQLYTSLVGLYDGISFGYELFGRVIVIPLQLRYAADYRRLLWNDYAHCLATITTTVDNAPGGLAAYTGKRETDESVIRAMAIALLNDTVRKERNGLLFAIAIAQLSLVLWPVEESVRSHGEEAQATQLAKTLFGGGRGEGREVQTVRQSLLLWQKARQASTEEQERRSAWVEEQLST